MTKPSNASQEAWDAALQCAVTVLRNLPDDYGDVSFEIEEIARAIDAAKAEAHRDLVDCLDDMTKHYVELASSGDCGFWNPEQEMEVIAARRMIAEHRAADVNAAHNKNKSEA